MAGILAACAAPAIVRADSLMRIVPRRIDLSAAPSMAGMVRVLRVYDVDKDAIIERLDIFDGEFQWSVGSEIDRVDIGRARAEALATLEQSWRDLGGRPLIMLPLYGQGSYI